MEHHRSCEACNLGTCTEPKATHPYLKRRSVSSVISKKSTKSSGSESKRSSFIDTSTALAEEMHPSNPQPVTATHVTADHDAGTDDTNFNGRIEAAEIKVSALLVEAGNALTESNVISAQDAAEEHAETNAALQWAEQTEKAKEALADAEQKNEGLLKDVNAATDGIYDGISVDTGDDSVTLRSAPLLKEDQSQAATTNQHVIDRKSDSPAVPISERPPTRPPQPTLPTIYADSAVPAQPTSNVVNNIADAKTALRLAKQAKKDGWHTLWSFNFNAKW